MQILIGVVVKHSYRNVKLNTADCVDYVSETVYVNQNVIVRFKSQNLFNRGINVLDFRCKLAVCKRNVGRVDFVVKLIGRNICVTRNLYHIERIVRQIKLGKNYNVGSVALFVNAQDKRIYANIFVCTIAFVACAEAVYHFRPEKSETARCDKRKNECERQRIFPVCFYRFRQSKSPA